MAITNRDRVGKALELLGDGLAPFVELDPAEWDGANPDQPVRGSLLL